jgi:hypothetical protein
MIKSLDNQNVYLHNAKPEWGGAVIAWEREGKRGYQFEDGLVRVFGTDHYHLLDPIEVSSDRVRLLLALAGRRPAPVVERSASSTEVEPPSLEQQLVYFKRAYPDGFAGDAWRAEHRGGAGRALKRHRDPAIAAAQALLTVPNLTDWLDQRRDEEGMQAVAGLLGSTDLVAAPQVQRLASLPPHRSRAVLAGLLDLLYGKGATAVRIVQWVQALSRGTGKTPGWNLATAPLALLWPTEHVCVHRASFLAQAVSVAPQVKLAMAPSGLDYAPLLAMTERVRVALSEAGTAPADYLDVYDFVAFTLRPAACREMAALS